MTKLDIEEEIGENHNHLNLHAPNGDLRVSITPEHDEVLVYREGQSEPVGRFRVSDGEPVPLEAPR